VATFNGSSGSDVYTGGIGDDLISGNAGNDTLSGDAGNDTIAGGIGADSISGGDGTDVLFAGARWTSFSIYTNGPEYPPVLDTGTEVDTLSGGNGSDYIFAGYGDHVDGGDGYDILYLSLKGATSGITADFSQANLASGLTLGGGTIQNMESVNWVQGSDFDDTFTFDPSAGYNGGGFTAVYAGGGNDHVTAGYYTGWMYGEAGDDVLDGRNDLYLNRIDGGDGNDTLYAGSGLSVIADGGSGDDVIYSGVETHGGSGNDHILLLSTYYAAPVYGEDGNDTIEGVAAGNPNNYGNSISGGAGSDVITGGANDDVLASGNFVGASAYAPGGTTPADDTGLEHDVLSGGGGNDILSIGYGDDADGGDGTDRLSLSLAGATSRVTIDLTGITGATPYHFAGGTIQNIEALDHVTGTAFSDTFTVGTQPSLVTIAGGAGDDMAIAAGSSVEFQGGSGNDTFVSGIAGDRFDGGAGFDTADYSGYASAITVTLGATAGAEGTGPGGDALINVEQVLGSAFGDTLTGSNLDDRLFGGDGNDQVSGGAGHDILVGGSGGDTIDGGDGNDHLYGQSATGGPDGADSISGGAGSDYLQGNAGNDTLDGGDGSDRINGGADSDSIVGGLGNDSVNGNLGADTISGGDGNDYLRGGQGDDLISGGNGNDQISGDKGVDTVSGGAGADLFSFEGGTATISGSSADVVQDYLHGTDHILLGFAPAAVLNGSASSFATAETAAQTLFDGHAGDHEVAAIQVGSDTFLFFAADAGGTVDSAVQLQSVSAPQIDMSDFL